MFTCLSEAEEFRSLVFSLHKRNPSWTGAKIATELESYENPPNLNRNALRRKINRILKSGSIKKTWSNS